VARGIQVVLLIIALGAAAASGCGRSEAPSSDPPAAAPAPVSAADDELAVRNADQTLAGALQNGNASAAAGMLDAEFTWITHRGVLLPRASVLALMPKPAILDAGSYTLEARRFGSSLAVVQRHSGRTHAMNVWVKREAGWRVLHTAEVGEGDRVVYGSTKIGTAPCVNPCTTVPFVPATPVERAVMESWQAQQSGPEQWARHVPEDNVARTSNGTYTKTDRIGVQQRQVQSRTIVTPSPLHWARIWEFGDSALMALQPRAVGKPFWGSRVFELRDGTWVMAEAYQITIQDTPPF
jgi:hypothetical protein